MDASQILPLLAAILVGLLLGGFYFGSLAWTVRRMVHVRHPVALYFGGLLLRLAVLLSAFYMVLGYAGWTRLVACLVGFLLARFVLTRWLGPRLPAIGEADRTPPGNSRGTTAASGKLCVAETNRVKAGKPEGSVRE